MNAVTCLKWISRGVAKHQPDLVKLTESEIAELITSVKETTLNSESETENASDEPRKRKVPEKATNLSNKVVKDGEGDDFENESTSMEQDHIGDSSDGDDDEDNDDDADDVDDDELENEMGNDPLSFSNVAFYKGESKDPHLDDAPDSDDEDLQVLPDDNLVVIGKVKKDFCSLEIYIYNEKDNNCFCHHDVLLPTIPLCMEWLDFDPAEPETPGNFLAVGNVGPDIEVWDLDVVNSVEPAYVLAGAQVRSSKKGKKKRRAVVPGHADAVLSLSWSRAYRHVLASASADYTVALWDLSEGKVVTRITLTDKVQSLEWQPGDNQSLVVGCADQTVNVFDCSSVEPEKTAWTVDGEVEVVAWDKFSEQRFFAGTNSGYLYCFGTQQHTTPVFHLLAHSSDISAIAQSHKLANCVVTVSTDKTLKVWQLHPEGGNDVPTPVFSKKLAMGQLFDVSSCPESSLLFAVAGEVEFRVLNLAKNTDVTKCFGVSGALAVNGDDVTGDGNESIDVPIGYDEDQPVNDADDLMEFMEAEDKLTDGPATSAASSKKNRKKKKAKRKVKVENDDDDAKVMPTSTNANVTDVSATENDTAAAASKAIKTKAVHTPAAASKAIKSEAVPTSADAAAACNGDDTSDSSKAASVKVKVKGQAKKSASISKSHPAERRKKHKKTAQPQPVDGDKKHLRFN